MTTTPVNNNALMAYSMNNTYNPYGNIFNQPDYFDSVFPMQPSTTQQTTTQNVQPQSINQQEQASVITEEDVYSQPDNVASALLENYKLAKDIETSYVNTQTTQEATINPQNTTTTTPPTQGVTTNTGTYSFEDMMMATQIANQFANSVPIQPQTTNDIFAQQYQNYGTNAYQNSGLNYAA